MSNRTQREMYPLVESWEGSGEKKSSFCAHHQMNIHTFNYWLKKYRSDQSLANSADKSNFISLQVTALEESSMELRYPNGVALRLYGRVKMTDLERLIQMPV